jgi:hypothetical protein
MSKLYLSATSDARKTEVTSRGHRTISAHVRGWDLGVKIEAHYGGPIRDEESFDIYVSSGSNGGESDVLVGRVALHDGNRYFYPVVDSIYCGNGYERKV